MKMNLNHLTNANPYIYEIIFQIISPQSIIQRSYFILFKNQRDNHTQTVRADKYYDCNGTIWLKASSFFHRFSIKKSSKRRWICLQFYGPLVSSLLLLFFYFNKTTSSISIMYSLSNKKINNKKKTKSKINCFVDVSKQAYTSDILQWWTK